MTKKKFEPEAKASALSFLLEEEPTEIKPEEIKTEEKPRKKTTPKAKETKKPVTKKKSTPPAYEIPKGYRLIKESKTEIMTLRTTPSIREDLNRVAKEQGLSTNELLNTIIEEYMKKKGL